MNDNCSVRYLVELKLQAEETPDGCQTFFGNSQACLPSMSWFTALRILCVRIVSLVVLIVFVMFSKENNVYVCLLCICYVSVNC